MTTLKRTPLFSEHKGFNATLVPFAGFEMPIMYSSMVEEHQSVRHCAGIFDVSHMGEIQIRGKDAVVFSDYLITNRTSDMQDGDIRYSPMCYEHGGQVDDLLAYRINQETILLVVNASNIAKDFEHIQKIHQLRKDLQIEVADISEQYGQIAFQGPRAEEFLQALTEESLESIKAFKFKAIEIAGIQTITSRTGYTGEDGFEILADPNDIARVWRAILEKGLSRGVQPCGLGARDTLRFEAGLWLYGNDIDEQITPLEAGQNFAVKLDKDFVGRAPLLQQKERGVERSLHAMVLDNKLIPRHGMDITHEGQSIGFVSSGNYCPAIQKCACMGYLRSGQLSLGEKADVHIRNKVETATIVPKPFYKGTAGRKDRR